MNTVRLPCQGHGHPFAETQGEKLYFNLSADSVDLSDAGNTDSVKGQMVFRGKTGKHIEERKDKTGKPYLMFSAFSTEKVNDGFEYQWVRFFCFGKEKEEWLQPGVKVDAKGEMSLSLYDGKPDISAVWKNSTSMCRRPATITDDGYGRLQTTERDGPNSEEKALDLFAEMMIEKIESINEDWRKPWFTEGALQWPRNLSGREYNGMNAFMLMLHCEKEGYKIPASVPSTACSG